jgi:hypothetical protein
MVIGRGLNNEFLPPNTTILKEGMIVEMFFCRQRMGGVADNYSHPCSFTWVGWSGAGVGTSDTPPKSADGRGIAVGFVGSEEGAPWGEGAGCAVEAA